MKQKTEKSMMLTVVGSSVLGLAGVLCVGMLAYNALSNSISARADSLYVQEVNLAREYEKKIDDYNSRNVIGIVLPKDVKSESLDSLEVAGVDTRNIIRLQDNTLVYMIQPGDTLTHISATLGYSVDEIANFNQIRNVNLIYANSALRVPGGK